MTWLGRKIKQAKGTCGFVRGEVRILKKVNTRSFNMLATWWEEPTHWKRPWCWERLKAGREGDDRGWDGWTASPTQWTWVWTCSGRWWRTGKPGRWQSTSVQSLSHVQLFATPWTAACQASLSITNSRSLLKLMSIELVMPSNHLCHLLLLPSIFPSIRFFSNESVLCIRWPKSIGSQRAGHD